MRRNRLLYGMIVVLAVIYAFFRQGYGSVVICLMLIFFPVVEGLMFRFLMRGRIRVEFCMQDCTQTCTQTCVESCMQSEIWEQGEKPDIRLNIRSDSSLIRVVDGRLQMDWQNPFMDLNEKIVLPFRLISGEEQAICPEYRLKYPGRYRIRVAYVKVYDFLFLFSIPIGSSGWREVIVLPVASGSVGNISLEKYELEGDEEKFSRLLTGNDCSELVDIRPYRWGDMRNRIHWKQTVKNRKLMVKDYGFALSCNTAVFLDFSWGGHYGREICDRLRSQMERMMYLCQQMLEQDILFYLVWYDVRSGCADRAMVSSLEELYEAIRRIYESGIYEGAGLLAETYHQKYGGERLYQACYFGPEHALRDREALLTLTGTQHMEMIS